MDSARVCTYHRDETDEKWYKPLSLPKATLVSVKSPYYSALPDVLESAAAVEQVVTAETAMGPSFIQQALY